MKPEFFIATTVILGIIVVVQFIIIRHLQKKIHQWGVERYIGFTSHVD